MTLGGGGSHDSGIVLPGTGKALKKAEIVGPNILATIVSRTLTGCSALLLVSSCECIFITAFVEKAFGCVLPFWLSTAKLQCLGMSAGCQSQ